MPAETTPMLLGIHGKRRSGKNTAAEILEEWCGDQYTVRSQGLADDLKKSGLASLGSFKHFFKEDDDVPMAKWMELANQLKETGEITINIPGIGKWTITGLEFWQLYGTEGHRDIFDPDFWVNNLLPRNEIQLYKKWGQPDGKTLTKLMMVTDVRFPNEAERIKELGGFVLKIRRPEADIAVKHLSEKPLPNELVDEVIPNDESLEEFENKIRHFAHRRLLAGLGSGTGRWD